MTTETIKLPHRSYPQNPIIADALYMTAFLESWGTGVSRMVEACKSVGLPEPEYGTDGSFVWITFKRPKPDGYLDTYLDTYSDTNPDNQDVTSLDTNNNTDTYSDTNPDNQEVTSPVSNSVSYSDTYSDTNPDYQTVTSPYSNTNPDYQIVTNINPNTNPDYQTVTSPNANTEMSLSDRQKEVVAYCIIPRSSREILEHIDVTYHNRNIMRFIHTLVNAGYLVRTFPNSPNAPTQKYVAKRKVM